MISNDKIAEAARQALERKQANQAANHLTDSNQEKPSLDHASEIDLIEEEIAAQYKEPEVQNQAVSADKEGLNLTDADFAPRYPTISPGLPDDLEFEEEEPRGPKPGSKEYANEVVWEAHPCWRGMIAWYFKAIGIVLLITGVSYLAATVEALHVAWVPVVFIIGVLIVIGLGKLIRQATVYTITRSQVSERTGILNTQSEQARLERITNITISRNIFERLIGIGKINIDTANDKEDILDWWGIPKPYNIQAIIDDLRIEQELRSSDGT